MTIIPRNGLTYISEWLYEFDIPNFEFNAHTFSQQIINLEKMITILSKHNLFVLETIQVDAWRSFDLYSETIRESEAYQISEFSGFSDFVFTYVQKNKSGQIFYPIDMVLLGRTYLVDKNDNLKSFNDILWIWSHTNYNNVIHIFNNSDVWMPFDLFARPQEVIFQKNAPNLEKALTEIELLLQQPDWSMDGLRRGYAGLDKYKLKNVTWSDGTPMNLCEIYPNLSASVISIDF